MRVRTAYICTEVIYMSLELRICCLGILFTLISCQSREPDNVIIDFDIPGEAAGNVKLSGTGESTEYVISLQGLTPNTQYAIRLYGGKCDAPSASFTPVADLVTDNSGNGRQSGRLLFHGQEDIGIDAVTDNSHVLVLQSDRFESCKLIPSLK